MDFRFCSDQHAIWDPRCNSRKLVQEGHWTRAAMLAMARNNNVQHCHLFPLVQRAAKEYVPCILRSLPHATNPVVQLTGIHGDLDYSLLPKEEPRHGRYLCLDPFLTVYARTVLQPSPVERRLNIAVPSRACRPTFEMFPRPKHSELFSYLDHLNLRLGPNPTVTLRRLRPCFCSHRLTPLRLSSADTPPLALFQSYPS